MEMASVNAWAIQKMAWRARQREGCEFLIPHVRHNGSTFNIASLIVRNFDGPTEDTFD